jgi:hypothetical protein
LELCIFTDFSRLEFLSIKRVSLTSEISKSATGKIKGFGFSWQRKKCELPKDTISTASTKISLFSWNFVDLIDNL